MSNNTVSSEPQIEVYNRLDTDVSELLEYVRLWAETQIELYPETIVEIFYQRYCEGKIRNRFTDAEYLANKDIVNTVTALGMDVAKFWCLMLFMYDYISCLMKRGEFIDDIIEIQGLIKNIEQYNIDDFDFILYKDDKQIKVSDFGKQSILRMLQYGYENLYKNKETVVYEEDLKGYANLDRSYMICQAVEEFKHMFDLLIDKNNIETPRTGSTVSLNRMLLISRIVCFYGWTKNKSKDSFWSSDNSIKGIYNTYKTKVMPDLIAPEYSIGIKP